MRVNAPDPATLAAIAARQPVRITWTRDRWGRRVATLAPIAPRAESPSSSSGTARGV